MRKIIRVLIMSLLVIPVIINAKTYNYNEGQIRANNYINSFSDRSKYLFFNTNYGFSGGSITHADGYVTGGMLNKDEYILGDGTRQTYLSPGAEYWTMTLSTANTLYTISNTLRSDRSYTSSNIKLGVRVTEFVKPEAEVTGYGTQKNPWRFVETYKVTLGSNDTNMGTIVGESSKVVSRGENVNFNISPVPGYSYKKCSCTVNYNDSTKMITINNVISDMNCLVTFDRTVYTVSLKDNNPGITRQAQPETIYMKLTKGWFYDRELEAAMPIGTMIIKPERTGYTFRGFKYSNDEIIDETGSLLKLFTPTNLVQVDQKLTSIWEANQYVITYDANGGSGAPVETTYTFSENGTTSLSSTIPTRTGFAFLGWSTSSSATSATYSAGQDWPLSTPNDTRLYAVWRDNSNPSCTLKVTASGVSFDTKIDNVAVTQSGINKSTNPSYTNQSASLSNGTFYGHVIDAAGNKGKCSVSVESTVVTMYNKETSTCNESIKNFTKVTRTCKATASSYTCRRGLDSCTSGTSWNGACYTTGTYGTSCTCKDNQSSYSWTEACQGNSCPCAPQGATQTGGTCGCSSGYTTSGTKCYKYKSAYNKCSSGTKSGSYCYKYNQSSCGSGWSVSDTNYSYSWSDKTTYESSCSTGSKPACSAPGNNGNKYVSSCTKNYQYTWSTSGQDATTCSLGSSFTCNATNKNSSYVSKCEIKTTVCQTTGFNKLNNSWCYKFDN